LQSIESLGAANEEKFQWKYFVPYILS